jgi:Protein of unknown function (DUF4058)
MVAKEVPMPLRDHFRPPVSTRVSWEEIHAMWPARIVLQLRTVLPKGYVAGPKIHAGSQLEIDVATFEQDDAARLQSSEEDGGAATATRVPPEPTVAVQTEVPDYDEYEVCIYDAERGRQLVAAIELVSPGNKDRPEKRNAFVGKCAALLQKEVAVSIVDVVTPRQFNLYAELLHFLGQNDPTLGEPLLHLYAASCRWRPLNKRIVLQTWSHTLNLDQPLPTLPLWLTEKLAVPLDLEQSYEQACHDLWLT